MCVCVFFLFFPKESLIVSLDIFVSDSLKGKRYIQFSFATKTWNSPRIIRFKANLARSNVSVSQQHVNKATFRKKKELD